MKQEASDATALAWWGILFPEAGQLSISALTIAIGVDGSDSTSAQAEVRSDVWPDWLFIAREARDQAAAARATNPMANVQPELGQALRREMLYGMTCICAIAFTLEAFTNSVVHHQPQTRPPGPTLGSGNRKMSADGRIHQVWNRAFRLPNSTAKAVRVPLQQIFRYRDQAVHPAVAFVAPTRHAVLPVDVHPRYAMFRTENADTAVTFVEQALPYLMEHPRGTDGDWLEWCRFMRTHI